MSLNLCPLACTFPSGLEVGKCVGKAGEQREFGYGGRYYSSSQLDIVPWRFSFQKRRSVILLRTALGANKETLHPRLSTVVPLPIADGGFPNSWNTRSRSLHTIADFSFPRPHPNTAFLFGSP